MQLRSLIIAAALVALTAASAAPAYAFKLSSSDLSPTKPVANKFVFKGFGCEGDNISPALAWSGAPKDTKSSDNLISTPRILRKESKVFVNQ